MTRLFNRRGWDRLLKAEMECCKRYGHPAGVVSIDLDFLKEVNDLQGHAAGDRLLTRAADAIRATIRTPDVAARLGGDEFSIIAVECDAKGIEELASRLQHQFAVNEVEASLGHAVCDATRSLAEASVAADQAMYAAKLATRCRRWRVAGLTKAA